jgi:hypothetical protein
MKLCVPALIAVVSLALLGCSGSQSKPDSQPAKGSKTPAKPFDSAQGPERAKRVEGAEPKAAPAGAVKSDPAAAAPKADPAAVPQPAAKSDPAAMTTAVAAAPKAEPKSEPKAEPVAAAEPPKAEPAAEPKPEPKAEPKPEPKPTTKVDPKEVKGEVVAVVDGEKIGRAEFDAFIAKATGGRPIPADQKAMAERQIMDMFINQKLLKKFIDAQKIEIDEEALFDAKLRTYLMNASSGGPKNEAEALALAKSIRKELDGGADFAALAKKHSACPSKSKGGDLGEFAANRMVQPFSDAVKAMKVNDLSEPVKTEFGYHVIQRLPLAAGSPKDNLHARHILIRVAEASAGPEAMRQNFQKLVDDLRGKAKIDNKLPAAPATMGLPGMPGMPGDDE